MYVKLKLFLKIAYKFRALIFVLLILYIVLLLSIEKQPYSKFDEKSWYDDENISEKMSPDIDDIDVDHILRLKEYLEKINEEEEIHHKDKYIVNVTTLIIVIQVHDRSFYLEHLLKSLENVKGISKCMIIFSHDYFHNETSAIIQNTYFTKYMEIYYPYSIQMHPRVFPGQDVKFCSKNMINCEVNLKYRDGEKTQLKHHWWWTVSIVFDKLEAIKNYNGNILFLEEDQYVAKDLVFVIKLIEKTLTNIFPKWDMISLGPRFPKIRDYHINEIRLDIEPWGLNENIAVVFNRTFWKKLKKLDDYFCRFNDYSWSNSLAFASNYMINKKIFVASVKSARVFRFEKCEYSNDTYCHDVEKVIGVQNFAKQLNRFLYPLTVSYTIYNSLKIPRLKVLGGWRDVRDYELCMFYTSEIKF